MDGWDNTKKLASLFFWSFVTIGTVVVLFDPASWGNRSNRPAVQVSQQANKPVVPQGPTYEQILAMRKINDLFATDKAKAEFKLNGTPTALANGYVQVDFWFKPSGYNPKGESKGHLNHIAETLAQKAEYSKITVRLFALGDSYKPILTGSTR